MEGHKGGRVGEKEEWEGMRIRRACGVGGHSEWEGMWSGKA